MTLNAPQRLEPRAVPLGGIRALPVRRTMPQRDRWLIGAWCFLDHYGPTDLTTEQGMSVPRHPHVGLQTVSWLFAGAIDHRDSAGNQVRVNPGELNLMTAGFGITHSEFAAPDATLLHGVQLWLALPDATRDTAPTLTHYRPAVRDGAGWSARVALGSLLGEHSPVATHTPTLLAELTLEPGCTLELTESEGFSSAFEYGVLVDQGAVTVNGEAFDATELACIDLGGSALRLTAQATGARIVLIGGTPLGEPIVMWWNFVGRTHDDIVVAREAYARELADPLLRHAGPRFGPFAAGTPAALPAPPLPQARLLPRR